MWELDHKEGWAMKKLMLSNCGAGEDFWESLGLQGDQSWIFIGRTMLKLKLQFFSQLMRETDSLENILLLGKIEGRRKRGWHRIRWLDGITNSTILGDSEGQGSLACCSPWGHRESDMTKWLNNSNKDSKEHYSCSQIMRIYGKIIEIIIQIMMSSWEEWQYFSTLTLKDAGFWYSSRVYLLIHPFENLAKSTT